MRKNPYLKDEQEFRPLLMRGSLGNNFLLAEDQTRQELLDLLKIPKTTYVLDGIHFDMIRPPTLNPNGLTNNVTVEMCATECTQELFFAVMHFNYSKFKDKKDSNKRPMERVTWFDCIAFCNELSIRLGYSPYYSLFDVKFGAYRNDPKSIESTEVEIVGGNGFRLPTESEWLFFAKAGTENAWSGTNNEEDLKDYAWYKENANAETHLVGSKKPNAWGMYDMSGNVCEWCEDDEQIKGSSISGEYAYKGGGWGGFATNLHSDVKTNHTPNSRYAHFGFRFARTIE
jgi:sulfatase modifying factor 1